MDEIQTGFGRSGKLFGFQHSGIEPDLVTVAKSLAGGLPLSGVVGRAEIVDAPQAGGLGGTYGGNPLSCAAAHAVLDIFEEENLLERSEELGAILKSRLLQIQNDCASIGDVRGWGSMCAVEFVTSRDSKEPDPHYTQRVIDHARDLGLLVIKCGVYRNVVRFLAPLVISDDDARSAADRFAQACLLAATTE